MCDEQRIEKSGSLNFANLKDFYRDYRWQYKTYTILHPQTSTTTGSFRVEMRIFVLTRAVKSFEAEKVRFCVSQSFVIIISFNLQNSIKFLVFYRILFLHYIYIFMNIFYFRKFSNKKFRVFFFFFLEKSWSVE